MPTPDFILALREKIGHDELWLPGVTGLVVDDRRRILTVRRADDDSWTLITGILDPGEQPAHGIRREVLEETGVRVRVERLLSVEAEPSKTFPNGDRAVFLDTTFLCSAVGGRARVNDDESRDVRWFARADLPPLPKRHSEVLERFFDGASEPWFVGGPEG
ncbi:NUDIX domain-containing protein [Catenulispora yoronensis]|uniref:NUDIX domain-containing protein n=1 Tax=Catenulispora yoronensis TaxID=450799 RepID=A0ABN2V0C3_9ACTN